MENKFCSKDKDSCLKKSEGTESAKKRRSIFNGKTLIVGDSNQRSARQFVIKPFADESSDEEMSQTEYNQACPFKVSRR